MPLAVEKTGPCGVCPAAPITAPITSVTSAIRAAQRCDLRKGQCSDPRMAARRTRILEDHPPRGCRGRCQTGVRDATGRGHTPLRHAPDERPGFELHWSRPEYHVDVRSRLRRARRPGHRAGSRGLLQLPADRYVLPRCRFLLPPGIHPEPGRDPNLPGRHRDPDRGDSKSILHPNTRYNPRLPLTKPRSRPAHLWPAPTHPLHRSPTNTYIPGPKLRTSSPCAYVSRRSC